MAGYLVDSDVAIEALRGRNESLIDLLASIAPDGLALSVITYGEVYDGILRGPQRMKRLQQWKKFLAPYHVLDVTVHVAEIWADLRGTLRLAGKSLPDNDLLIASTAQYFGLTLITRNVRHFARVEHLDLMPAT